MAKNNYNKYSNYFQERYYLIPNPNPIPLNLPSGSALPGLAGLGGLMSPFQLASVDPFCSFANKGFGASNN